MASSFDLPTPDLFTAGTIGPPGQRVFYLQARGADVIVSLRCEKQQVAALAEYLAGILEDLPPVEPGALPGDLGLVEPVVAEWAIGSLAVGWDEAADRVLLVAEEFVGRGEAGDAAGDEAGETESETETAQARFRISRAQATAFVERARELVASGRPPCPICGGPLDPEGHVCPRSNGHRATSAR